MRLEHIPLIIGAIVALIGLGFIADALMADSGMPSTDRRRRVRAERSRAGEAIVGVGVLCMAAALFGRDTWRYGTLSVMVGTALILIGVVLNRTFLKETLFFRGPARRADPTDPKSKSAARQARPANRPPATRAAAPSAPVPLRPKPVTGSHGAIPTPTTPRPAAPGPRPMAAATTPAAPMRAIDPPAPKPVPPPVGKVERRKNPRGKK